MVVVEDRVEVVEVHPRGRDAVVAAMIHHKVSPS
jgi:hypothetical protein